MRVEHSDSEDGGSNMGYPDAPEVSIGPLWEAIGPFPSGMREHPMMASPLHAFPSKTGNPDMDVDFALRPYNEKDLWPSELAEGGHVGWSKFDTAYDGWVQVSFDKRNVDWQRLRQDHGWAALQYQTLLRTQVNIPPQTHGRILVDLVQGTEFALVPRFEDPPRPVRWYAGDVYAFADSPAGKRLRPSGATSNFARPLHIPPGDYVLIVRAMYEIRMFGDPQYMPPTIRFRADIQLDHGEEVQLLGGSGAVPDVVDGWLMGDWLSVGLRHQANTGSTATVTAITNDIDELTVNVVPAPEIWSGQVRRLALRVHQKAPLPVELDAMRLWIHIRLAEGELLRLRWHFPLKHISSSQPVPFHITFASPTPQTMDDDSPALVSYAVVKPPRTSHPQAEDIPVIVATHGAGVDIDDKFWIEGVPSRPGLWAVLPTGKNEWGEDWHGASAGDAWAARDALPSILQRIGKQVSKKTLLVGHSNGGQGAWHLAARYPDRIVGLIAAAGWLKIQDYVPYTETISSHFADPALLGILQSSLTPYNNDLYASNLTSLPILAIHGASDGNVPPRHSRTHVSLVKAWAARDGLTPDIQLVEYAGRDHWWQGMFEEKEVAAFLDSFMPGGRRAEGRKSWLEQREDGFTLTTADPDECGTRAGIRVLELNEPGKLARLDVNGRHWDRKKGQLSLHAMNVRSIEVVDEEDGGAPTLMRHRAGRFLKVSDTDSPPRAVGPMIRLLSSTGPITFVLGSAYTHAHIATRLAHDIYIYHRTDSRIVTYAEWQEIGDSVGSVVFVGRPEDALLAEWNRIHEIPVTVSVQGIEVDGRPVPEAGAGIIALRPHPTNAKALACVLDGRDAKGLELAARLFPIRTGVPIPDWVVVGQASEWRAAAGFIGAGFWSAEWGWSNSMSWMDR